ncbi:MAG TPA: hypothetical protein IAA27_07445 [Candidatus Enterococcus stercoravium]|nr:hypothetical protein [Candidatus Enterococcus stercoravium]
MKQMRRLHWVLELLIRALSVLETIWIGQLVVLKTAPSVTTALLLLITALLSLPLIQKLRQKWPLFYHVIAMGILGMAIWAATGFSLFLGCLLLVIALFGSLPSFTASWALFLYPLVCYLAGFLLNAISLRLLALLIVLLLLMNRQLLTWLKEVTDAQTLSKAVSGHGNRGFLTISRKQLLLMLGGLAITGLTFVAILAWLQPFGTFSYSPKEGPLPQVTKQSQAPMPIDSPDPAKMMEKIVGKSEPNQLLVAFWEIFEQILKLLLLLAAILLLLTIGFQMIHYLKAKRPVPETEELPELADFVLLDQKKVNRRPPSLFFGDYNHRVRQRFKKEIRPSQYSATPRDLMTSLEETPYRKRLLTLYEKARYDEKKVTKEEWQALKTLKKES